MHKPPVSIGWEFSRVIPGNSRATPVKFTTTGNYSFDSSRDVVRSISGFVLLPEDREELDLSSDRIIAYLTLDGVQYQMGIFVFVEDVEQKGVVLHPVTGVAADLTNIALGDQTTLLVRNTGAPETLYSGFSPTFEMRRIVGDAGLAISTEAEESADTQTVTWDGNTTDLAKIRQLAEMAGHAAPWMDNTGTIRSVSSAQIFGDVLRLEKDLFLGETGSISITNNYLSIPNRVIVSNNTSTGAPVVGVWDAPASWPSSSARRGYIRAVSYTIQGLATSTDAERVAATLGKRMSARRMTARLIPTHLLDGPRVIEYGNAWWTVQRWDMGTAAGSQMNVEAEELFVENDLIGAPLVSLQGVL